ncbi:MAG: sulfatase-like hydrolase/transferase [Actinomycetota bacterium]|nr:sulfatase-like hydrolase/transferase [Actinomycetota bacterium]
MTGTTSRTRAEGIGPLDVVVSCVVLFVLAVAQPLLDLLGRNAEFFLARAAPPIDIVLLGLLLTIVMPLLIGLGVVGVRKLHHPTGTVLHWIVLAIFGGMLVLQIISHTPLAGLPAWVELVLAGAAGLATAFAFYRYESLRSVGRFSAIAPIVVLGLFLFGSSVSQLVFASNEIAQPSHITIEDPAPIVMVIFDEFPIASLMDGDGNIQEDVYPGFARLAEDGTWFRNAVTVQQQTENSLPAILSGKNPPPNKLPTAGDHPFTLFTLLADTYDLQVQEAVTDLCPEYACENASRPVRPMGERWRALVNDLRIISGHLFLPNDMADDLPPVDTTWSNFSGGDAGNDYDITARFQELTYSADRRQPIAQFTQSVGTSGEEPRLFFLHALVPHVPWEYLPSGQTYSAPGAAPGSVSPGWGDDVWLVDQAYQMHLAQVGYVDGVIEDLIAELEEAGLYDETMIVVLADHGITVRPDTRHRRVVTEETVGDVAAIPLFIKRPYHGQGEIDDYRAETVDVLPTLADVLGIELPWTTDGISLFGDDRPERTESRIEGTEGTIVIGADGSEARAVAARKIDHFGTGGPFGLAPPGHADLLGRRIEEFEVQSGAGITARVRDLSAFGAVDVDGPSVPAWISGTINKDGDDHDDLVLAVVVNGRIAAVTRSDETEDGKTEFGAMIRPDAFVDGKNDVDLVLIRGVGDDRQFWRVRF